MRDRLIHNIIRPALLLLILFLLVVPHQEVQAAKQSSIYLKEKKVSMIQCEYHRLKLKGADSSKVKWESSNPAVAEVSTTGRVHALSKGKCKITAVYKKKKYVCKVTVEALTLSASSVSLVRGRQANLSLNSRYASRAAWRSTNPKIAKVDSNGCVEAVARGSCEIQAKWRGVILSCEVTVLSFTQVNLLQIYPATEQNYGKIVLAGSSSMDLWFSAPQAFAPYEVINMAIGGTRTVQWLEWHESMIVRYNPSAVVIYVGSNDLGNGKSISGEENAANTISLIRKLRSRLKGIPIFYVGVCPCYLREGAWTVIKTSNTMMQQFCRLTKNLYYLDLTSSICGPDGKPNPNYFLADRLHPSAAGYEVWKKVVAEAVKEELDKRKETTTNK